MTTDYDAIRDQIVALCKAPLELGEDEDSRKAEATWRECQTIAGAMRQAFGADLEAATELAHQL